MCTIGVDVCPDCEASYNTKSRNGTIISLTCPNGHTWTVTSAENIGEFYPNLAY